jgi:hypothetical protein
MSNSTVGDAAIAVVRRNTEEVQGKGNWDLYEELFADDFVDHTPQPGTTPDKNGVRGEEWRRQLPTSGASVNAASRAASLVSSPDASTWPIPPSPQTGLIRAFAANQLAASNISATALLSRCILATSRTVASGLAQ